MNNYVVSFQRIRKNIKAAFLKTMYNIVYANFVPHLYSARIHSIDDYSRKMEYI